MRAIRRALLVGPPNSWKTSASRTWVDLDEAKGMVHHIVCPGELGYSAVPNHPRIQPYIVTTGVDTKEARAQTLKEMLTLIAHICAGKLGNTPAEDTIFVDGIHKLYLLVYERAWDDTGRDPKLAGQSYGAAHIEFKHLLENCHAVKRFAATVWDQVRKEDPDDRSKNAAKATWTALPGQVSRNIVGEFSTVFYCRPGRRTGEGFTEGSWLTRPSADVQVPSMKFPAEYADQMLKSVPNVIRADWMAFERQFEAVLRGKAPSGELLKPGVSRMGGGAFTQAELNGAAVKQEAEMVMETEQHTGDEA